MSILLQLKSFCLIPRRAFSRQVHQSPSSTYEIRSYVRKHDYDGFLCGLLLPKHSRDSYFALRAFNAEIAKVKDIIRSNPSTGQIRVQWWKDAIEEIYKDNSTPDHPFIPSLAYAIRNYNLTKRWFDRLLDMRAEDLNTISPETITDLERYSEATYSSLMYLSLEVLGIRDDAADSAARHAGISVGFSNALRGLFYHLRNNHTYIPNDILHQHGMNIDILASSLQNQEASKIIKVVQSVAEVATMHMDEARKLRSSFPRDANLPFLATLSSSLFLQNLKKSGYDLSDPQSHEAKKLNVQLLMYWFSLRKTF